MPVPRRVLVFLFFTWVLVVLYPDPGVLVSSIRNLSSPDPDAVAARALAAGLPDDPGEIERAVLADVVPYASDWDVDGVPWSFPSAARALRARRGDCESRALVLASVLVAKGIPCAIRMSFDHMWVDYPGKAPTSSENEARALARRDGGGWSWPRWPEDLEVRRELRAQAAIFWDPMPSTRKVLLFGGIAWIALWNALAMALTRPPSGRVRLCAGAPLRNPPTPSSAAGGGGS